MSYSERCPQFRGVLIEGFHVCTTHIHVQPILCALTIALECVFLSEISDLLVWEENKI